MRIVSIGVPLLFLAFAHHAAAQQQGTAACTNSEIGRVNAVLREGFDLGVRIGSGAGVASGAMEAYERSYERTKKSLSPGCGKAFAMLERALQQRQQMRRRPSQASSILYDQSSNTYHAPGLASCGPSGCTLH